MKNLLQVLGMALLLLIPSGNFQNAYAQGPAKLNEIEVDPSEPEGDLPEGDLQSQGDFKSEAPPKENLKEKRQEKPNTDSTDNIRLIPFYFGDDAPVLEKKEKNGTYVYKTKPSPQKYSGGFRVGPYYPADLQGDTAGITYENIYGSNPLVMASIDFEDQFFKGAGKLAWKVGLGFATAQGQGRFLKPPNAQADTVFNIYFLPLNLSLVYHLQFAEKQIFVPFGEAGGDYFGIIEARNDKDKISDMYKLGAIPAAHFAGGLQIQLDSLDKEGMWQTDSEYGINHIYLTVDYRQIIGLNSTFDFSASYFEGGISFEF